MLTVKLEGIESKFRMDTRVCVEHTLNELKVSKRMRETDINLH